MLKRTALIALLLAANAAIARAQVVDPQVGCYEVKLGEWNPPLRRGDALYQTPPGIAQLTQEAAVHRTEQDRRIVRPVIPHGFDPQAYWKRVHTDSLHIVWTNGHAGVRLHLEIDADSLHGSAIASTDVVGLPQPKARVVLHSTPCAGG